MTGGGAGSLLPGASPAQHPPNMLQSMEEMVLPPKRQAVVDRLRRRIETYRRRQSECVPRFDQSFSGACEQQNLETSALQKRFLEGKAKRQAKKNDRKPDLPAISSNLHSSVVHVQQKFGCGDYEPPAKLQCGVGGTGVAGEALTKFSVEIVQQLEFTTSAADSQPQQISTNVTVKALANAVKTSSSPPPQPPRVSTPLNCERECKAECKSEVAEDEFVDLDECAAALERDAASAFPGLADLIGEDDVDDRFEDLITEISEYPEFMKDFDLDGGKYNGGGIGFEPPEGDSGPRPYSAGEMSPAAQTLKHMAEQHQQAAGGDWARYRGYAYRPRAAPPPIEHLHMSQQQQLHLTQPHHNLQVSAAQHMQVSGAGGGAGHVSVAAQQGMYASFQHQGTPSPQHHQSSGCDSYSVSQSQSINFTQAMRARPANTAPQSTASGAGAQPLGVAAAGISREQQAKMLQQQQQQMLRAQQVRPPPPEYKARFVGTSPVGSVGGVGNVGGLGPGTTRRAPASAPRPFPQHPRQYSPEWRHVLMQQQAASRQQFPHHHQGFGIGGMAGSMTQQQQQQMQMQQARLQQQQLLQHQQQRASSQQSPMSHLIMQQNQMMSVQGQIPNIHMSQSQSMSMQQGGMPGMSSHQGSPMQGQTGPIHSQNTPMQNSMMPQNGSMQSQSNTSHPFPSLHNTSSFPGQTADFNLDFLDNMPSTDASNLTAQELLNSLDNSFLNDILILK